MDFDLEDPLASFNDEEQQSDTIDAIFASELEQIMPSSLLKSRICFRQQAISLILQGQYSGKFNPILSYLAATYVDRFIATTQEIPKDKPWILRLLVIASASLASKMNQSDLSFSDIQRDEAGFVFDAQTITRMELMILNALNWRMRPTTPFSFLSYFISLTNCRDPALIQTLKARVVDIIYRAHQETAFLDYNPSVIASSAVLHASRELIPVQYPAFRLSISSCKYINTEKLWSCYRLMEEKLLLTDRSNNESSPSPSLSSSTTKTPRSVLDNHDSDRFNKLKNRQNDNSGSETVAVTTVTTEKDKEERKDVKRQRRLDDIFCTC